MKRLCFAALVCLVFFGGCASNNTLEIYQKGFVDGGRAAGRVYESTVLTEAENPERLKRLIFGLYCNPPGESRHEALKEMLEEAQ